MRLFAGHGSMEEMLATIEAEYRNTAGLTGRSRCQPRVLQAMAEVPRQQFVPADMKSSAFANSPLPIGQGQTISQPFIVALMTDLLAPLSDQRILEVGTGSGYQTAILSRLASQVYSVEIISSLAQAAQLRLVKLGFRNIEFKIGDGHLGWPEQAPFDGVMVTAAASHVPDALLQQIKNGGRLVIPVGLPGLHQELLVIERKGENFHTTPVLGVSFVPLVRKHGES